ncbi:hypothetical protein LOF21_25435 [Sinorhizobium meliloti]|uniref:hypothetical protein n=1 Tax=Rhizobium meliloti TaxID=382 RepID=UPI001F34E4B8|nr:hypothetical protein [Sinorhizobium meliloti]MDE4580279.1 hypothetical protein [Sinorhizobium meliloti]
MPGWQFSSGCATELLRAVQIGIPLVSVEGASVEISDAISLLSDSVATINEIGVPIAALEHVLTLLKESQTKTQVSSKLSDQIRKDQSLDRLADMINVAQFVSFSPTANGVRQEFARILGFSPNDQFPTLRTALTTLLERSPENSINLRSFTPENPKSREFVYGIKSVDEAVSSVLRLASEGLYVIANETVDVNDGGVSGVLMGDVIEFAPDSTPRGVEKGGFASLPRQWGLSLLGHVYGFMPDLSVPFSSRLEFSVHPKPRGWRHGHTLAWEYEPIDDIALEAENIWPNHFSRMIGDKVYGLLVAHVAGFRVPLTTVINRRVGPFSFGRPTGSSETWLRTSPIEQVPGKFTTTKGWADPFALVQVEDPDGSQLASVLSQAAILAKYSGAAIVTIDGSVLIEGTVGEGDAFMKGDAPPEELPSHIIGDVQELHGRLAALLGPVRLEWVHDGRSVWIVQLHKGATQSSSSVLVPGEAENWVVFDLEQGLESLRSVIRSLPPKGGLLLKGKVGVTSHVADVVRKAQVPARFV